MEILSTRGVNFPNGMPQVTMARNHTLPLNMRTAHVKHMVPSAQTRIEQKIEPESSFAGALQNALQAIEKIEGHSKTLTAKAVYAPDTVEAHQVLLAAEKSRFALNLTKSLADALTRTFRELSSPR